jgi:hypothetical protein
VERPIRGPDLDRPYLDSTAAGAWISEGVSDKVFEGLMARHLPTVRPIRAGRRKLWAWFDVAILGYLLARGGEQPESEEE